MNAQEWFDNFDGPKELGWNGDQFNCFIGFNVKIAGSVRGYEIAEEGGTPSSAISAAREHYERICGLEPFDVRISG